MENLEKLSRTKNDRGQGPTSEMALCIRRRPPKQQIAGSNPARLAFIIEPIDLKALQAISRQKM